MRLKGKLEPKHRTTLYLPYRLIEAFKRYAYERELKTGEATTLTDTITELLTDFLKREGYYSDEDKT